MFFVHVLRYEKPKLDCVWGKSFIQETNSSWFQYNDGKYVSLMKVCGIYLGTIQ